MDFKKEYSKNHAARFENTLRVMKQYAPVHQKILDLGPENPFTEIMRKEGYDVTNTPSGLDLDYHSDHELVRDKEFDLATSFEIFEHMVNPFSVLMNLGAQKLIATVPLRLWFAKAYWNDADPYDRHYHEFEDRQFDMLLEKSGWEIIHTEKWVSRTSKIGFRPLLRNFTPRHYLVVAKRRESE